MRRYGGYASTPMSCSDDMCPRGISGRPCLSDHQASLPAGILRVSVIICLSAIAMIAAIAQVGEERPSSVAYRNRSCAVRKREHQGLPAGAR
jgi:hypothetical protein